MFKKGKLVIFSGIDGSGKTTQSVKVTELLRKKGVKAASIKVFSYFFLRYPISLFKSFKRNKWEFSAGNNPLLNYKKKNSLYKILPIFLLIDHWFYYIFKIYPKLLIYDYVICDRYFYDFIPTYFEFGYASDKTIRLYAKLIPKPDFFFFLQIFPKTAYERKSEYSLLYLQKLDKIYSRFFSELSFIIKIDGKDKEEKITNKIVSIIL